MRYRRAEKAVVVAFVLLASLSFTRDETRAQQPAKSCAHRDGWKLTDQRLRTIMARHAGWLAASGGTATLEQNAYLARESTPNWDWAREARLHPERAMLCNATIAADLSSSNLRRADLSGADMSGANLSLADLSGAEASGANLSGIDLGGANLGGANLASANLARAILSAANLSKANLSRAELDGANLERADLIGANLSDANLSGGVNLERATLLNADLSRARLAGAWLVDARLNGARLGDANLSGANLSGANLTAANLTGAELGLTDMSRADLSRANLSRAIMNGTTLTKARLTDADLTEAVYAPQGEPPENHVVGIKGLSTVSIPLGDDIGMIQLRKLLQDAGIRDNERAATSVIERSATTQQLTAWRNPYATIEGLFRLVAFDLTTAYGLYPGRALGLILAFVVVFAVIYLIAIWRYSSRRLDAASGIFQVFPADGIDTTGPEPVIHKDATVIKITEPGFGKALRSAAYFSILSAFNIGFESFNVGDWIRRVQAREYTLQPTGWVRVVSGVQSLLSLYLLAIWVLTYFGRPFQ